MKKLLLSLALLAVAWLTGTPAMALEPDSEGVYQIGTREELLEWSELDGHLTSNVKLTADINDVDFMLSSAYFSGTFDGAGHTITLKNPTYPTGERKAIALFASTSNATIKNLTVAGKITTTVKNSAGLSTWNGGATTFENVVSIVEIDYNHEKDNASNGGFIGYCKANATFTNCVAAPTFTGNKGNQNGFVGWRNAGNIVFNNCICVAEATGNAASGSVSLSNPTTGVTATNTYIVKMSSDPATPLSNARYCTKQQLESGEIAYAINTAAGKNVFYQDLGTDAVPVPFSTHATVYASGHKHCDLTDYAGVTYNNISGETTIDPHDYSVCPYECNYCHYFNEEHIAKDGDGFYHLSSANDVEWFSAMVNDKFHGAMKVKLDADIDFGRTPNAHRPIGTSKHKFFGQFDGQRHRIMGMVLNNDLSLQEPHVDGKGFFGSVRGGGTDANGTRTTNVIIENLIIDGSCSVEHDNNYAAGVVAHINATESGATITIRNCGNEANVYTTGKQAAGILGCVEGTNVGLILHNLWNKGNITGKGGESAAICAWTGQRNVDGEVDVEGCWNIGEVDGVDGNGYNMIRRNSNIVPRNIFELCTANLVSGTQGVHTYTTGAPLNSGELCYLLNGNQSTISFKQLIGTDEYPSPFGQAEVKYVGAAGYSTLCKDADFELNGDVQASIITGADANGLLTETSVSTIPANEGVLLAGTYYNILDASNSADNCTGNKLVGVLTDTQAPVGSYVLQKLNEKVAFYRVADGKQPNVKAGKAYLDIPDANINALFFDEEDATAINGVNETINNNAIYNVAGQRISKMQRGVNIVNGKKVLF